MAQNTPLPLVPQNTYTQAILKELHAVPYDPTHHNGMRNPYSHKKIMNQQDYEEYVREYVYYRLCDELVIKKYTEQLAQDVQQLETQHRSEIRQINARHEKELGGHRRRWLLFSACIALIITLSFTLSIPGKERASYDNGLDDGYLNGYEIGHEDGLQDGYENGYHEGHLDGYDSGREDGFQEGTDFSGFDAFTSGYENGYQQALSDCQRR